MLCSAHKLVPDLPRPTKAWADYLASQPGCAAVDSGARAEAITVLSPLPPAATLPGSTSCAALAAGWVDSLSDPGTQLHRLVCFGLLGGGVYMFRLGALGPE
jgi:hypothetical protein